MNPAPQLSVQSATVDGMSEDSRWASASNEDRRRKKLLITVSDDERAVAEKLAEKLGDSLSRVVGAALLAFGKLPVSEQREAIAESHVRSPFKKPKAVPKTSKK